MIQNLNKHYVVCTYWVEETLQKCFYIKLKLH